MARLIPLPPPWPGTDEFSPYLRNWWQWYLKGYPPVRVLFSKADLEPVER
jgi:hypothetical protein